MTARLFSDQIARSLLENPFQEDKWSADLDSAIAKTTGNATAESNSHPQIQDNATNVSHALKTSKLALLAQRLLDNNSAEEAENLCKKALLSEIHGPAKETLIVKLLESLARQGKVNEVIAIYESLEASKFNPWVKYFYCISLASQQEYAKASKELATICNSETLRAGGIDTRVVLFGCALALLAEDCNTYAHFVGLLHLSTSQETLEDLLCFQYLKTSLPRLLRSIKEICSNVDEVNSHFYSSSSYLLLGPAFGHWNMSRYASQHLLTIRQCETIIQSLGNRGDSENQKAKDDEIIMSLSIIHHISKRSPNQDSLAIFQMLERNSKIISDALDKVRGGLAEAHSYGYKYQPSKDLCFMLNLEEEKMEDIYKKICSDLSAYRLSPFSSYEDPIDTAYRLTSLMPVAEIDIDFNFHYSSSIISLMRACKAVSKSQGFERVFLLPWLKTGGADKVAIDWINYCTELDGDSSLVLLTEPGESEWLHRLNPDISAINSSDYIGDFSLDQQAYSIALCIQYLRPAITHNINSNLGYIATEKFGKVLSSFTNLSCHIFCNDKDRYDQWDGYGARHQLNIFLFYKYVFSDHRQFLDSTIKVFEDFLPEDRHRNQVCEAVYVPTLIPTEQWNPKYPSKRCFWTGRFDKQKRLDILGKIALHRPDITFDIYGKILLSQDDEEIQRLAKQSNINIKGAYDNFYNLPVSQYDFYIMTSEWEGLPNTLLEAASCGLPIIAPNVGGISEFIKEETGYLVDCFDDIGKYIDKIDNIYEDFHGARRKGSNARKLIEERHTYLGMRRLLNDVGYLSSKKK
jgi:glycosyltransferase involved in cell wall biosynthesis